MTEAIPECLFAFCYELQRVCFLVFLSQKLVVHTCVKLYNEITVNALIVRATVTKLEVHQVKRSLSQLEAYLDVEHTCCVL